MFRLHVLEYKCCYMLDKEKGKWRKIRPEIIFYPKMLKRADYEIEVYLNHKRNGQKSDTVPS